MNLLEERVITIIEYVVPLVEACGALVIIEGVIRAFLQYLRGLFSSDRASMANVRLRLVESLVVGLEFQVAADVLKTAISPSWDHILVLAAVVVLRGVLGYLLDREAHTLNAICTIEPPHPQGGSGN
jgi:uncharacterized membrane protein